jgi:hypothetical protein
MCMNRMAVDRLYKTNDSHIEMLLYRDTGPQVRFCVCSHGVQILDTWPVTFIYSENLPPTDTRRYLAVIYQDESVGNI